VEDSTEISRFLRNKTYPFRVPAAA